MDPLKLYSLLKMEIFQPAILVHWREGTIFWGPWQEVLPIFMDRMKISFKTIIITLPKTNIAPKNQWLEDVFPIEIVPC